MEPGTIIFVVIFFQRRTNLQNLPKTRKVAKANFLVEKKNLETEKFHILFESSEVKKEILRDSKQPLHPFKRLH